MDVSTMMHFIPTHNLCDFHCASQYLQIVHLKSNQHTKHPDKPESICYCPTQTSSMQWTAALFRLLTVASSIHNRLTSCSVRLQWLVRLKNAPKPTSTRRTPIELGPTINETTSWLRFVCQLTVSRPVNSLCKVLFQLSLTVLVCYRCRSNISK